MTARLEAKVAEVAAENAKLRAEIIHLHSLVAELRCDSAEAEARLADHCQRLDHLAQDVRDVEETADGVADMVCTWAPTLARLLPLFKALHWPDDPRDIVPIPARRANDDGAGDDRQPG